MNIRLYSAFVALGLVACTSQQPRVTAPVHANHARAGSVSPTTPRVPGQAYDGEVQIFVRSQPTNPLPRTAELVAEWRGQSTLISFIEASPETFGVPDPERIELLGAEEVLVASRRYVFLTWAVVGPQRIIQPLEGTEDGVRCRVQPFEMNHDYSAALCLLGDGGLECRARLTGRRVVTGATYDCVSEEGGEVPPPESLSASWSTTAEDRMCTAVQFDGALVRFLSNVVCETREPVANYAALEVSFSEYWETLTELNGLTPEIASPDSATRLEDSSASGLP